MENLNDQETFNHIKIVYREIFQVNTNFELLFTSVMLYINFKYEDIFSDPSILELMARNNDIINTNLRLFNNVTRRQLESIFLTLHYFLCLMIIQQINTNNNINHNHNLNLNDDVD